MFIPVACWVPWPVPWRVTARSRAADTASRATATSSGTSVRWRRKSPRSTRSRDCPSWPGKPATNSRASARARATWVVISGMCATAARAERLDGAVQGADRVAVDDRHRGQVAVGLAAGLLGDAVEQLQVAVDEGVGDVLAAAALAHGRERVGRERVVDHDLFGGRHPLGQWRERGGGLVVGHQAGGLVDHVEPVDAGPLHAGQEPLAHLRDGELLGVGRAGVHEAAGVAAAVVEEGEPVLLGGVPVGRLLDERRPARRAGPWRPRPGRAPRCTCRPPAPAAWRC